MNNLLNYAGTFHGVKIIIRDPSPIYVFTPMFKKHRKKRSRTIVRKFSHYQELIGDGQVIDDGRGVMYMNRNTYTILKKAL